MKIVVFVRDEQGFAESPGPRKEKTGQFTVYQLGDKPGFVDMVKLCYFPGKVKRIIMYQGTLSVKIISGNLYHQRRRLRSICRNMKRKKKKDEV